MYRKRNTICGIFCYQKYVLHVIKYPKYILYINICIIFYEKNDKLTQEINEDQK